MKFKKVKFKKNFLMKLWNESHISFNPFYNKPETALYLRWDYYIYNWDYRDILEKAKTPEEALDIFLNIKWQISSFSDDFDKIPPWQSYFLFYR